MKKKTKRQAADEAYLRVEAARVQVSMFDDPPKENPPLQEASKNVPAKCVCGRVATRPATWTHMHLRGGSPTLQCGQCGAVVAVTQEVWEEVRDDSRQAFIDRAPDTKARERRVQSKYDHY